MRMHLDLTLEEAVARLQGEWAKDIAAYDKVHVAILDACRKLGVAPGALEALRDVDNLDVQVALAPFLAG